jgi:uncharacterized membrane protein
MLIIFHVREKERLISWSQRKGIYLEWHVDVVIPFLPIINTTVCARHGQLLPPLHKAYEEVRM